MLNNTEAFKINNAARTNRRALLTCRASTLKMISETKSAQATEPSKNQP